jgi:hypothetical protein
MKTRCSSFSIPAWDTASTACLLLFSVAPASASSPEGVIAPTATTAPINVARTLRKAERARRGACFMRR